MPPLAESLVPARSLPGSASAPLEAADAPRLLLSLSHSRRLEIEGISPRVFRLRATTGPHFRETLLNRYKIINPPPKEATPGFGEVSSPAGKGLMSPQAGVRVSSEGEIQLYDPQDDTPIVTGLLGNWQEAGKILVQFRLKPGEKIFGLGDVSRDGHDRRGQSFTMWVRNVASYVPVPFLMSSDGWGLFINTTERHFFNVGETDPDLLTVGGQNADPDFYLFRGTYREMIDDFTRLTGRPALLPLSAYGLTFVVNQQETARELLDDCRLFREMGIPCDTIGLEPGWMQKYYDYSTEKKWDPDRFYVPEWAPIGPHTFVGTARRMGFKVSLWLCCGYDISYAEEAALRAEHVPDALPAPVLPPDEPDYHPDDFERDHHCGHWPVRQDQYTKPEEPWFHHLRAFVDQGVSAFKLDGAVQVNEHPDRLYGNGLTDAEMHNIYPTLLNKQMSEGYREHTSQRPLVYSSGGYVGIQRYSATWAGDTGGDARSMVSLLNHGFNGHSNVTCDMDVFSPAGIHFGFFQTWSQVNSWAYFRHPWFLGEKLLPVFRFYAGLRYRLLAYVYAAAMHAHRTGFPVMRALPLAFPDLRASEEDCKHTYLLGDSLLVTAFSDVTQLPPGTWINLWDGKARVGPARVKSAWPEYAGGPLFVRAGAILPTVPPADHVGQRPWSGITLHVFPGAAGQAEIYEDDGVTFAFEEGAQASTTLELRGDEKRWSLNVGERHGDFAAPAPGRSFRVMIYAAERPARVTLDGNALADAFVDAEPGDVLTAPLHGIAHRLRLDLPGDQSHCLRINP